MLGAAIGSMQSSTLRASLGTALVLLLGASATFVVARGGPDATESASEAQKVLEVETERVEPTRRTSTVLGSGRVEAARSLDVTAEVRGQIVYVSERLAPGGRFEAGELMLRIDPRDYRLDLQARRADVANAKLELERARARREVAHREQNRVRLDADTLTSLALRKPQMEAGRAGLAAARAEVKRAKLQLRRTRVTAPWDAAVVRAEADEGQLVAPGNPLARLVGVERFWVRAAVPVERLSLLPMDEELAVRQRRVEVIHAAEQGRDSVYEGRLLRRVPSLDRGTQRALVLVEVRRPLEQQPPLLPGAFVEVVIEGRELKGLVELPPEALHDGRYVFRVDAQSRLERVRVERAFVTSDDADTVVLLPGALERGDRVVTKRLPSKLEGREVRIRPSVPDDEG